MYKCVTAVSARPVAYRDYRYLNECGVPDERLSHWRLSLVMLQYTYLYTLLSTLLHPLPQQPHSTPHSIAHTQSCTQVCDLPSTILWTWTGWYRSKFLDIPHTPSIRQTFVFSRDELNNEVDQDHTSYTRVDVYNSWLDLHPTNRGTDTITNHDDRLSKLIISPSSNRR
jgi:hypothetical protein